MPRVALPTAALAALLALTTLAACDAAPGLPAEVRRPSVTAFALTPAEDSLATSAMTATVPLVLTATLAGEGRIVVRALVRYAESPSGGAPDTLAAEARVEAEPGEVRIELPLTLPRGATGDYAVTLTTEGADGRTGDGASAVFRFRAASLGPPAVTGVTAASSVTRPAADRPAVRFPVSADVTDPDGLANVTVVALFDASGGLVALLYDEGGAGRSPTDAAAGDGRYTTSALGVTAETPAGTVELSAVAFDRAGGQSEPFPFTFEIR